MAFQHISSEIGALEAEEVGVEHLLRDVKDTTISTLATRIHDKLASLKSLISHLHEMYPLSRFLPL
jgi:26S proteasome regulatory subunit N8